MPGTGGYSASALCPAPPRLALVARCLRAWPSEVVGMVECGRFAYNQARPRLALVARCVRAWPSEVGGCLRGFLDRSLKCHPEQPLRIVCLARGAISLPLFVPRVLGMHLLPAACVRGPRVSLARWELP